jgi:2-amino-4-hydroxy-6-hydroxymethyldihydropteridine diphosphokinase
MPLCHIALGSNLGDRLASLRAGVAGLERLGRIEARSSVWETQAVGPPPDYLNAAVALRTELPPVELLTALLALERTLGRVRTPGMPGPEPRTLDLDLLLYEDRVVDAPTLLVPHPRLHERAFVLEPLAEIAPTVIHPLLQRSILALRDQLRSPTPARRRPERL